MEPGLHLRPARIRVCFLRKRERPLRVAPSQVDRVRPCEQALAGELTDRLQHRKPIDVDSLHETGVDQLLQRVVVDLEGACCFRRPAAAEDRQSLERVRAVREKLVAPVKRASQCPLTTREVPRASNEHRKAALQSLEQLHGRKRGDARSRELDRQWEPVDAVADLPDHRIGLEASVRCEATLDEELHCVVGIERQDSILGLASQAESRAARDQYAKVLGFREQTRHEPSCLQEVLEVVEHEQEPPRPQTLERGRPPHRAARHPAIARTTSSGSRSGVELDEEDAVAEASTSREAAASASRVLPLPPGRNSVTSASVWTQHGDHPSSSRSRRPAVSAGAGRFEFGGRASVSGGEALRRRSTKARRPAGVSGTSRARDDGDRSSHRQRGTSSTTSTPVRSSRSSANRLIAAILRRSRPPAYGLPGRELERPHSVQAESPSALPRRQRASPSPPRARSTSGPPDPAGAQRGPRRGRAGRRARPRRRRAARLSSSGGNGEPPTSASSALVCSNELERTSGGRELEVER